MLKKIIKGIGITILVILVIFSIIGIYTWHKKTQYESTAVPYIKDVLPKLSTWDVAIAKQHMATTALEKIKDEELSKLFKWFSKLGALKSMEEPQFQNVTSGITSDDGANTVVTYTVVAHYEKADANIVIRLLDKKGQFKIFLFNINSDGLMQ